MGPQTCKLLAITEDGTMERNSSYSLIKISKVKSCQEGFSSPTSYQRLHLYFKSLMMLASFWIHLCYIWNLCAKETHGLVSFNCTFLCALFLCTL